jgi:hypothetical protein
VIKDEGRLRYEGIDLEVRNDQREWYSFVKDDVDTVRGETRGLREMRRGDWRVETRTRTVLTSTREHFTLRAELDAYEEDRRVFAKSWDRRIERDLL